MKTFWVLWTYMGNYSEAMDVAASSPDEAADIKTSHFSDDFRVKATVYVFDREPMLVRRGGINVRSAEKRGAELITDKVIDAALLSLQNDHVLDRTEEPLVAHERASVTRALVIALKEMGL